MDLFEAITKKDLSKIKDFVAKGFDPTTSRSDGLKVLHVAATTNSTPILELLLKQHNVQCDITDNDGNTPLHLAAQHSCIESVRTLLAFGAHPSTTNKIGKKPLNIATNQEILNILSDVGGTHTILEVTSESNTGKSLAKERIQFMKEVESQLPGDILTLKSFAIEFMLANQLFQERCKEAIYQLVRDKHEVMYKKQKLENDAGIRDRETGEAFLENLEKIEEENEIQAATIARLKIQNHMLEQNANQKTDSYRKNLSDMIDQQLSQVKNTMDSLLEKETKFFNDMAELSDEIYGLRCEKGNLLIKALSSKTGGFKPTDIQFFQSVQNDNYLIQKALFDTQAECTMLGERLKSMEILRCTYEKDINKIRNDSGTVRKALQETMTKAFTEARTEADDKEEESGHIIFAKGENGRKQVKAATLEKLFDRLCDPSTYEHQFQTTFLLTFRSFTDTSSVINYMIKRYKDSMVTNTSNPASQSASNLARQRICQTIKDWVELCWFDFQDKSLLQKLTEFVDYVNRHNSKNATLIRTSLNRKTAGNDVNHEKSKDPPPKPILPKSLAKRASNAMEADEITINQRTDRSSSMTSWTGFNFGKSRATGEQTLSDDEFRFVELDPLEVARQLTLIEYQLFTAIKPTEFLDQAWLKEDKEEKAPNICEMIRWSYHVSMWVVSELVSAKDVKLRAAMKEKFIAIASSLEQINNFNGVKEVLTGLQSKVVKGLYKTNELVNPRSRKAFEDLEKLTNQELNYKQLRAKIHQTTPPLIPYPGVYQADLSAIDNSSKSILENRMINYSKYQKLASYITELQVYQQSPYNFEGVVEIAEYIKNYEILTESEATKIANAVEAKIN